MRSRRRRCVLQLYIPLSFDSYIYLPLRGQVKLGVEGRDRAFGRPSGRPARLAGVSVVPEASVCTGRAYSSSDPARGRSRRVRRRALRTYRRRTSQLGEYAPLHRALPLACVRGYSDSPDRMTPRSLYPRTE